MNQLMGLRVFVVPTWVHDWRWVRLHDGRRTPSKVRGRKGTRRAWKRAHGPCLRWRYVPVEPDHIMRAGDSIYCTATQQAALASAAGHR